MMKKFFKGDMRHSAIRVRQIIAAAMTRKEVS